MRRGGNHVATSRSRQMKVIASPMPTSVRASSASTKLSARANPTCATVITSAPVRITLRGPNRSTSSPTGTCMSA